MRFPLLLLVIACALSFACPMGAEEKSGTSSDLDKAWSEVAMQKHDHAPLLERQARLQKDLATSPVAIALFVLEPDLMGLITSVTGIHFLQCGLDGRSFLFIRGFLCLAGQEGKQLRDEQSAKQFFHDDDFGLSSDSAQHAEDRRNSIPRPGSLGYLNPRPIPFPT